MRRAAALLALATTLAVASTAHASFPGRNGVLAVVTPCGGSYATIVARSVSGRRLHLVGSPCEDGLHGPYVEELSPDWSPDGRRLLFEQDVIDEHYGQRFMTVAADGSDPEVAVANVPYDGYGEADRAPSFSPDGRRIAYALGGRVHIVGADGSDDRVLSTNSCAPGHARCPQYVSPRWSPDGRFLAVQRRVSRDGLWLMNARNGRLVRRLTRGGGDVDWSPDSRRLVFTTAWSHDERDGGAEGGNLYVVRADGRDRPRRIVHREGIAETSPVWSPDGRWIAWAALRPGPGDVGFRVHPSLWRMPAGGGRRELLATLPEPAVEEGMFDAPHLSWQPLPRR